MEYLTSGLLWAGIGIVICFLWQFVKGFLKAKKDPNVIIASELGMSMSIYRDCQEVYKEWYAWRWDESLQEDMLKPNYKYKRFPKNPNAFHRYEWYMNYLYDIKSWEEYDETTKNFCSYENPYKKGDYEWIRQKKIPVLLSVADKLNDGDIKGV